MTDHAAPQTVASPGEVSERLELTAKRHSRGRTWLSAENAAALARYADDRIAVLQREVDRKGREIEQLRRQVEMMRYGTLATSGLRPADPIAVDLTMRAQEEANRTIDDASVEGSEILAEARRQADDIIVAAHEQATEIAGHAGPYVGELQRQLRELKRRHMTLVEAAIEAGQQLAQWQVYLGAQADQLHASAKAAGRAGDRLQAAIEG
ncbi:hypothetical protein [Micromonospora sp. CB01531]|uniref:hypothetical protein n=1 Tax=Micromonospora sp. CB01531 TaxID=1718947 RepID=UPI00093A6936|nr:hypothetical protein [Micromonospora sp. CB01531]OKI54676.1 hypothetical protein A6A27_31680 [Micromonospora sp. CB01531]